MFSIFKNSAPPIIPPPPISSFYIEIFGLIGSNNPYLSKNILNFSSFSFF